MLLLLFLSLPWLLVLGDEINIKNEVGLEKRPVAIQKREVKLASPSNSKKKGIGLPKYYPFVKNLQSDIYAQCKESGFTSVEFPSRVLKSLKAEGQTDPNKIGTFSTAPAPDSTLELYTGPTKNLFLSKKKLSAYVLKYNDPNWWKEWHMQDYRTNNIPVMDHNVVPVFKMGITGNGVTVAILGEGIMNHLDLGNSLDQDLSYDFCQGKQKQVPWNRVTLSGYVYESQGNYNAGLIAMKADNGICGVGVAPNVRIAALKIRRCEDPSGAFHTDAEAFSHKLSSIDIYCNEWTSTDTLGEVILVMSKSMKNAIQKGITEGREKKGAIYIFPSGRNRANNNCAVNEYVNNPDVITIASANQAGKPASYSERCSAVFATAYSGDDHMNGMTTIDANGKCASYFTDTPAGPAIASGIIALLLEANPSLTYRDVMHIIAMTAEVAPLADNEDTWYRNGRSFWVSNNFGFGLLNAENMVKLTKNWKTVPDKKICLLRKRFDEPLHFDKNKGNTITIDAKECKELSSEIEYLEHVEVQITAKFSKCRGAMHIDLTSAAGTITQILKPRRTDNSYFGFDNWNLMSIQNWGENPKGNWKVSFMALNGCRDEVNPQGDIEEVILKLHGTQGKPVEYPRQYAAFRRPDGKTNRLTRQ